MDRIAVDGPSIPQEPGRRVIDTSQTYDIPFHDAACSLATGRLIGKVHDPRRERLGRGEPERHLAAFVAEQALAAAQHHREDQ
jgi:hypothetical protein